MSESCNRESYDAVVYLVSCALGGAAPSEEYLKDKDIGAICTLAARHSVIALVAYSLEKIGKAPAKATERKNMAIRRALLFDVERARILKTFESRGIRYLPLKGVLLKDFYPSLGLREMADNDILFDSQYRAEVHDIMVESGYEAEQYDRFNHDVYVKEPLFNFEMHVDLFAAHEAKQLYDYYKNLFDSGRLRHLEGTEYGYKMSDEDFYIYLKLHEYKHYSHGGTGLRSLADTYVFLRDKGAQLDFDYIDRELSSLGVSEYEKTIRGLAMKVFSLEYAASPSEMHKVLSAEEFKTYEYMCFSGTYGTSDQDLHNALLSYERLCGGDSTKAKRKYLWHRIFPPMKVYEIYYPFYYKHKILIPFLFLKRITRAIFKKPKKVWRSFVKIMKFDKKDKNEKKDLQK